MKKGTLVIAALIGMISFATAQSGAKISTAQKALLINKWFESPRESSGDTVTYTTSKHIHQPGVDNPAVAFSELTFSDAPDFNVNYWRWCIKVPAEYVGKYTMTGSTIKLDFGKQKCKCELTILDVQKDKLKIVIKETSK